MNRCTAGRVLAILYRQRWNGKKKLEESIRNPILILGWVQFIGTLGLWISAYVVARSELWNPAQFSTLPTFLASSRRAHLPAIAASALKVPLEFSS